MFRKVPAAGLVAAMALLASPVLAQDSQSSGSSTSSPDTASQSAAAPQDMVGVDEIMDVEILSLGGDYNPETWENGAPLDAIFADLEEIGTVQNVILNPDGQVVGLTTDIGGFIGIGQKTVLLPLEEVRLTRTGSEDEITIITRLDQQELESAPEFSMGE